MTPGSILSLSVAALMLAGFFVVVGRWTLDRRAAAWIRARYGDSVSLMSMCVVMAGGRRFRGAIGLAGDVVAWRAIRFNKSRIGEIELASIEMVMWEDARAGWGRHARDGGIRRLLTIRDRAGVEHGFVIEAGQAILWDKVLEVRLGALPDGDAGSE